MSNLEVEVKFYLTDMMHTRKMLLDAGAIFDEKSLEINNRFEDDHASLIKNGALLRLRQTNNQTLLTYKGKVPNPTGDCKVHEEREVTVSDFDEMSGILRSIGYRPVQRYEKIRETCRTENVLVCLDQMPYGSFMEIEGDPEMIRKMAESLDFEWKNRILTNYLAIFEALKDKYNLDFNDVTFDNFRNVRIDFESCLHLFVAG